MKMKRSNAPFNRICSFDRSINFEQEINLPWWVTHSEDCMIIFGKMYR